MDGEDSLPRLLSGRYQLEARLGHGGMGIVYRAIDLRMKRAVAVKLIRAADGVELDEEVAGRFLREAKNTARIQHEHIIEVYDLGRSETNDLYMVMELLEGESLSVRLRREGRLSPSVTVKIARQICEALEVAHTAGIIHRDLKPANVMLVRRAGDDAFVKVLDFGVAKSYAPDQQTQLTHTGMLVGTVEYMAPEQIMGRAVDARTDIYSLGVVLYRMLLGRPPFKDGGVPALIHAHLNVHPKPLHEQLAEIPGELDRVVLRCMAKRPEQRFESMAELARALAGAIEPQDLGLMSLEYRADGDDDDPYANGDKTEVGRASTPDLEADHAFEDATVKMDRPLGDSPRNGAAMLPTFTSSPSGEATAVLQREELSTARRHLPNELPRTNSEKKICAMCQTANAPHLRACAACGVSLAPEDQEAVRARVTAPRTVNLMAPQVPPPTSGAYPAGAPQPLQQPPMAPPPPMHGVPAYPAMMHSPMPPQVAYGAPPRPAAPPRASMWQRFLSWTGLK